MKIFGAAVGSDGTRDGGATSSATRWGVWLAVVGVHGLQHLQKVPQELHGGVLHVDFTHGTVQPRLWTDGDAPPQKQHGIVGIVGEREVT